MAEFKERSGLFKFFYIILRVITFPIFVALYVLKHPILVLVLLVIAGSVAVYFPLADGKTFAEVPEWYKSKYADVRIKAVKNLAQSKGGDLLSDELKQEAEDADRYKGENYNRKIVREDRIEEKTAELKKRGGFKRKNKEGQEEVSVDDVKESILNQSLGAVGGLAAVLKDYSQNGENEAEQKSEPETTFEAKPVEIVINEDILPESVKEVATKENAEKEVKPSAEAKKDDELDEFNLF